VILQPEQLLTKVNEDENIVYRPALFVQPGLQMIIEPACGQAGGTIRTYSSASIAENPMLAVRPFSQNGRSSYGDSFCSTVFFREKRLPNICTNAR